MGRVGGGEDVGALRMHALGAAVVHHGGLSAEIPSLLAANSQQAVNQTVSGVRVRSKIVPAGTDVRPPHPEHL